MAGGVDKKVLARSSPAGLAWWHSGGKFSQAESLWRPADHLTLLSEKIVDVATGRCPRLIVTMPPRHGKSELISRFAPAWFLGRFPNKKVILASYGDTFAAHWGRKARDVLKEESGLFGVYLNPDTSGGGQWELMPGQDGMAGVMVTAGIGGAITGKGADLMIIDDPVKNAEEAHSETIRDAHWEWWLSTARTRLMPGAGVIVVMTRWHEDDLVGRLVAHDPRRDKYGNLLPEGAPDRDGVEGDHWEIINLPAFAEIPDPPPHMREAWAELPDDEAQKAEWAYREEWRDPIGRKHGQVLWPSQFDAEWMVATKKALGLYWFTALYQQQPSPASGMQFKRKFFLYYERTGETADGSAIVTMYGRDGEPSLLDTAYCTKVQMADIAASEKQTADYTVVTTFLITPTRDVLVWDVQRVQFDSTRTPAHVRTAYWMHRPAYVGVERLGHGLNVVQVLTGEGLPIVPLEADTDKVSRSIPAQALYEAGKFYHPREAHWLSDFERELLVFPNGRNDDQVDTISYMGIKLPQIGGGQFRSGSRSPERESQKPRSASRRGRPVTAGFRTMKS